MSHISRVTRLRLILTGVMLTVYLLVLAVQAHAQSGRSLMQDERTAYFPYNETSLTSETRQKLDALVNDIKSRGYIHGARVVGFSDHTGSPSTNEKISRQRAENVRNYLISRGVLNASVADTRWFGDLFPATNCPEGLARGALIACMQNDRRVEVEVDYTIQLARAQ